MSDEYDFASWDEEEEADPEWEAVTVTCPECGFEIYEDAELCSHCGYSLEDSSNGPLADQPGWFVALGLLGILATILALSGLLFLN